MRQEGPCEIQQRQKHSNAFRKEDTGRELGVWKAKMAQHPKVIYRPIASGSGKEILLAYLACVSLTSEGWEITSNG